MKISIWILKTVLIIISLAGIGFFTFVLPRVIGGIDLGGYDPILLGMYITAIPFFVILYQTWLVLDYIYKKNFFSENCIKSLNYIKYCLITISGLYVLGMPYIFYVADKDDAPGVVAIALIIISCSALKAVFVNVFQNLIIEEKLKLK